MDRPNRVSDGGVLQEQRRQVWAISPPRTLLGGWASSLPPLVFSIWYSQCVAVEDANNGGGDNGEVRTLTTRITVDGPYPTVISTHITYLQPRPTRTTSSAASVVTVTLVPDEPCNDEWYC